MVDFQKRMWKGRRWRVVLVLNKETNFQETNYFSKHIKTFMYGKCISVAIGKCVLLSFQKLNTCSADRSFNSPTTALLLIRDSSTVGNLLFHLRHEDLLAASDER